MIATKQGKTRIRPRMRCKHAPNVATLEEQIRPLSSADKLVLIQSIAEMLREDAVEVEPKQALPTDAEHNPPSVRGLLHKYANPALIEQEETAWQMAMRKKHATG